MYHKSIKVFHVNLEANYKTVSGKIEASVLVIKAHVEIKCLTPKESHVVIVCFRFITRRLMTTQSMTNSMGVS